MKANQAIQAQIGIATSGLTKADHYSWPELDPQSRYEKIPIGDLKVDESYQRGEVSISSTIERAKNMSFAAAGCIIVGKRNDGTYWIVDGLQRTLAARRRGDISEMDCIVFDSKGVSHEAEIFLLANKNRKPVSAMHKYITSVAANRLPESEINAWITSNGMRVIDTSGGGGIIRFPSHMLQAWEMDKESCKKALLITKQVCDNELHGNLFRGASTLLRSGVEVEGEVAKIISLGGCVRLDKEINSLAITLGVSKSLKICALGLLNMINHKRRNKITVTKWI